MIKWSHSILWAVTTCSSWYRNNFCLYWVLQGGIMNNVECMFCDCLKGGWSLNLIEDRDSSLECFNRTTENYVMWQPVPVRYHTMKFYFFNFCWVLQGRTTKDENCMFCGCLNGDLCLYFLVMVTFSFAILNIMTSLAYLPLSSRLCQFKCCNLLSLGDIIR